MKISKQDLKNTWQNNPHWCIGAGLFSLLLVWAMAIIPLMDRKSSQQDVLITASEELSAIKGWVRQIKSLEDGISIEKQAEATESLLQQVERIGKETKVFHKISRISPSKIRIDDRDYEGISLEYEKTSMAEIYPFLEAISYRSILNIHEVTLQKSADDEGIINARLTLVGGKI